MKNRIRASHKAARAAGACALLASHVAAAQPATPATDNRASAAAQTDLPAVTVTAQGEFVDLQGERTNVTIESTGLPSGVTVVTPEELSTINVGRDISNIFRRVPGVVANNIDQGDTGNGFRMRGFATQGTHGADTAIYVDGVPQNMPSSQAGAGHGPAFLEWLTPDMIGGFAVIKGPISALYGDQNRAGAVDMRTANGGDIPSSVGLNFESYDGKRASLVLSNTFGDGQGRAQLQSLLIGDIYRAHGYRRDARTERDNLFWKLSTRAGDGQYSVRINHYRSESTAAGYLLLDDLEAGRVSPRSTQYGLPGFGSGERTGIVLHRAPAVGEQGWYGTVYGETFRRERGIANSAVQHTVGSDDRNFYGGRFVYNAVFGDTAALAAGAELRRDRGDAQRRIWRNWVPTDDYVNSQGLDLLTYGVFVQGQYRPLQNLKLLAGLRHDRFDYEIDNRKMLAASTDYRDGVTTPKFGAVWSVSPRLDLFANAAQGFRSPAAEQISGSGPTGPLGNPGGSIYDVSPSKVRSHDIGFTATPVQGWSVSGVVYHILNEDEIISQPDGSWRSAGETTRKGYELETRWQATRALSLYASYARILEARANNPLPNTGARLSVPRHQLKAGAQYRHRLQNALLTLNADAYLTAGNPYYVGTPQVQLRTMPTYTRYDLRATIDWKQVQWTAYAVFQPRRYASDIAYGTSAGLLVSPQPRAMAGVTMRYFF
ncbi:TonB-dependent receptor [Paracidovorax citrulli]